jgi:hypothetical protein
MNKKIIIAFLLLASLVSCKWTDENEKEKKDNELNAKDVVIGGDKDENGCLGSAGYTWSKLNKECVRVFTGIQLLPVDKSENPDDAVFAAYILFNESGDKAELFLPNQDDSVIVERESKGKPWTNGDWQLVPYKGYQLKKAGKLLYEGDGEIGNKVSGSDDSEDVAPPTE